jgi:hypothetical protein
MKGILSFIGGSDRESIEDFGGSGANALSAQVCWPLHTAADALKSLSE